MPSRLVQICICMNAWKYKHTYIQSVTSVLFPAVFANTKACMLECKPGKGARFCML
jgi:hypothetical protein